MVDCLDNKTKLFALRVIKLCRYLMEEKKEYVLSKQILRSGTSIGANARERKNAQSKLDFISKLSVSLKEADETAYWLELLVGSGYIDDSMYRSLERDLNEIIALLTASINTARANLVQ